MKIYTRSGDKGETGLLGGVRVSKSHQVIETCGTIDEANSHLGCAIGELESNNSASDDGLSDELTAGEVLTKIQSHLFDVGSRVAAALVADPKTKPAELDQSHVQQLEDWIDQFDGQLPALQTFILPGGSPAGCQLHLARTVCRRAERQLVSLLEIGTERDFSIDAVYLNRVSDLLFVLARYANQLSGRTETPWLPGTN